MLEDLELERFQARLLDLLHQDLPPAETLARLKALPESAPFAAWVAGFDLRTIEVAGKITRKFGERRGG